LADQHPLIHYHVHSSDGSAKKISDFWSQAEFHASALYELVYQPMEVEYQISITLSTLHSNVVAIVANRATSISRNGIERSLTRCVRTSCRRGIPLEIIIGSERS